MRHMKGRLGRRGAVLLLVGLLWTALGVEFAAGARAVPLSALQWWGPAWWGALWIVGGVICMASAWTTRDEAGYAVAVSLSATWSVFWFFSFLSLQVESLLALSLNWLFTTGVLLVILGWREQR